MQSHIRKVYACLAVTCHLRFWQDDRGLLRATAVTRGWNGYRNKSQHRKLTLEKKILPPPQQGFEPATFRSRVRRSNHWAIPAPHKAYALAISVLRIINDINLLVMQVYLVHCTTECICTLNSDNLLVGRVYFAHCSADALAECICALKSGNRLVGQVY